MAEDERWIWKDDAVIGPFSVDRLYRMAMKREIDHQTLYWSERETSWKTLPSLMFDVEPNDQLASIASAGIQHVKVLGVTNEDCPACAKLGLQSYPVDAAPALPPLDCQCIPWCRQIYVAAEILE